MTTLRKYFTSPYFYLFLAIVAYFGFTQLVDLDTGFHLAQGKYFFDHQFHLPMREVFAFSEMGQPNIIISWLFDVIFYGIYMLGGFLGLSLYKSATLVILAALFIWRLEENFRRKNLPLNQWWAYASAFFFLAATYGWVGVERPHVLGYIYFSVFLLFFWDFLKETKAWHWAVLGLSQFLWANTHTSFASGIAFTGIFFSGLILELWFKKIFRKAHAKELSADIAVIKKVFWLILLQIAVSMINPYGPFIFANVYKAALSPHFKLIKELWPITLPELMSVKGLFLWLAAIPLFRFWQKRDFKMFLAYLAFMIMGLRTGRLFYDFIVFSAPFTLAEILTPMATSLKKAAWGIISAIILGALFIYIALQGFQGGAGISKNTLPVKAADFIMEEKPQGPMFNSYGLGSYLIWRLYPDYQVYIDGRAPVYDQGEAPVLLDYYRILDDPNFWKQEEQRYGFNMAIVDWPFVVDGKTYNKTAQNFTNDEWLPAFFDTKAIVYLKRTPQNQPLIDKFGYHYIDPQQLDPSYLQKYSTSQADWLAVDNEFQRALSQGPDNYRIYFMYAAYLAQDPIADKSEAVIKNLKRALDLNPYFEQARNILNVAYHVKY